MLGVTSLPQVSMGAMMPALEAEYRWSRTELSSVLAVFLILGIVMAPVSGAIADHFGPRILIAVSSIMMSAIFLVLAKQQPTLDSLRLSYGLIAVLGAGTNTIVFSRLIANWFYTKRGMALGLALVGGGLTTMLVPYAITLAISANGWRTAYLLLSGLTLVIAPLALLVVRNNPTAVGATVDGETRRGLAISKPSAEEAGLSLNEAFRTRVFWTMAFAALTLGMGLIPLVLQMVPIMLSHGFDLKTAGLVAGVSGFMSIMGRLLMATLLDRVFAPPFAAGILLATAVAVPFLGQSPSLAVALVGAGLVGLTVGAEIDLLAYITSRYFGLRSFGKLFGVMYACFNLGAAAGVLILGRLFDQSGSYAQGAFFATGLLLIVSILLFAMPRYSILRP